MEADMPGRKQVKELAGRVAMAGAAGCTLAGLLSVLAWSWPLELICHFQVQMLLVALASAAVLALLRRWMWLAVALVGAFSASASVLPYETPGPAAHAEGTARE